MLRILSTLRSTVAPARLFSSSSLVASKDLFVGNMPFEATTADVEEAFAQYGQIERVNVPTNHEGRPRGFAFITFAEDAAADKAVEEMNGALLMDRPLRVSVSEPREPRQYNNDRRDFGERRERQPYGSERSYGGDRGDRRAYGGDRGDRQAYGGERRQQRRNDDYNREF